MAGRLYPTTGSSSIPRSGAGRIYPGGVWKRPEEDEQEKKRQEQENQRRIRAEAINNIPQPKQGVLANFGAGLKDVFGQVKQVTKPLFQGPNTSILLDMKNRKLASAGKPTFTTEDAFDIDKRYEKTGVNDMLRSTGRTPITSSDDEFLASPAGKFLNHPKTVAAIQRVAKETRDIPLRVANRAEAIFTKDTYAEATAETDRSKAEATGFKKFLYNVQSTGPQTAIGALLAIGATYATKGRDKGRIGSILSSTFFGALSADEQLQQDGKITSPGKIAVDVVGDRVLTASLTKVFSTPAKSLTKEIIKDFGIEGGTEVAQSLAKMGIDYNNARTDEERAAVLERAKQYVREEMVMEFAVGGVIGGGLGAATGIAGRTGNSTNITVAEDDQGKTPPSIAEQLGVTAPVEAPKERGGVRAELGITEDVGAPAQPVQMSVREQLQMAESPQKEQAQEVADKSTNTVSETQKVADPLTTEARKYKSAGEFVKAQNTTTKIGDTVPDYFKNEELARRNNGGTAISEIDTSKIIDEGYGNLSNKERDALKNALNDQTQKTITVYRSGNGEIKNGDFVALDKSHAEKYLSRGSKRELSSAEIPKENLVYNDRAGDFMYKLDESQLTDIWNKAQGTTAKKETVANDSKPAKKKTPTESDKKTEKLKSRVYERLQQERPEALTDEVTYDAMKLDKDAEKASRLVVEDKDKAYRIAMGMEESADFTSTAVSIALAEQALAEGNIELYNKLTINRSLRLTRIGQELVAEKGSVSDNSLTRYVKQLLHIRLEALGSSWTADIKQKVPGQKKKSAIERAIDVIDSGVKEAKTKISRTKSMDIGEAQKLIDSLKC